MRIGVSAFAWTADFRESHLELLPRLREQGLTAFEIPMFNPATMPAAKIRKAMAANLIDCTVCAILPAGINPISEDASVRRKSIEHLKTCLEVSAEMGARLLGGPIYAPIGYLPNHRRTTDEWQWAIEALRSLTPTLDATGITLAIEPVNRSETFFLRTTKESAALCDAVGHSCVGVTIDTFHSNIEEKNIPNAIRQLGKHLRHMHLSENDRGLLGSGHIDFSEIVRALRDTGYSGYLMIEGFGYSASEPISPGYLWADQNVSPEELAFDGAKYLISILRTASCAAS